MEVLAVNYPGDPMLIEKIVWELKSQGIFDNFRKECIADVDTKPAYQNLRQRVEGSVSSFLRKQTWSPDLNKNQLREQLRKNIYESGFLETGVERIVDQVVNPKMNTVFLPKVTDVVYQYLGLEKPDAKTEKEKEDELKTKSEELLPKELEAVSPESRHGDKNEDSNQSFDDMKIDEDESPPFEPLDEDNSVDSHLSGMSGLQSHDSNHSTKALQIDDTQMSKHSSDGVVVGDAPLSNTIEKENDEKMDVDVHTEPVHDHDTNSKGFEGDSNSGSVKSDTKKLDKERKSESKDKDNKHRSNSKSRSRSDSSKHDRKHESSSRSKDKYRDKDRDRSKDKDNSRDRSKSDKDKHRSSSSRHSNGKKDDRRDKERDSSSSSKRGDRDKDKDKERKSRDRDSGHYKSTSKSRDDKSRSKSDHRKTSSRSEKEKEKDKRDNKKDNKKDDHYSSKHKPERRSTDRDSNDGSGLKSSSSSYCESNSSSQHSMKESSNSNDSNGNENKDVMADKCKLLKNKIASSSVHDAKRTKMRKQMKKPDGSSNASNLVMDSQEHMSEEQIEIRPKTPPSMSVSAACWDELEAKLNSTVNYDSYYDPETTANDSEEKNETKEQTGECLQYFTEQSIDEEEISLEKRLLCIENLEKQIETVESRLEVTSEQQDLNKENKHQRMQRLLKRKHADDDDEEEGGLPTAIKKTKNNNLVGPPPSSIHTDSQNFHLPLSPAESDSDKSTDKKPSDIEVLPAREPRRKNVQATQRYSSEDLYKPRPFIKRTTTRRRGNVEDN